MFSAVLAIDGITNLSGSNKLLALERYVGGRGFDYIGNSHDDLPLWRVAKQTILVGLSPWLLNKARRIWSGERVIVPKVNGFSALFGALRAHQWVKNVLLFGPLIMAHRTTDMALVLNGSLAFVAFSLCASSVYIINDLVWIWNQIGNIQTSESVRSHRAHFKFNWNRSGAVAACGSIAHCRPLIFLFRIDYGLFSILQAYTFFGCSTLGWILYGSNTSRRHRCECHGFSVAANFFYVSVSEFGISQAVY